MKNSRLFGWYIETQRKLARLSVERVAKLSRFPVEALKDVERGLYIPHRTMWPALVEAIPQLQMEALRKCAEKRST